MAQMTFTHRLQPSLTWAEHFAGQPLTLANRLVPSCRTISRLGVSYVPLVLKGIVKHAQVIRAVLCQAPHAMRKVDTHVRLEQNRLLSKPAR